MNRDYIVFLLVVRSDRTLPKIVETHKTLPFRKISRRGNDTMRWRHGQVGLRKIALRFGYCFVVWKYQTADRYFRNAVTQRLRNGKPVLDKRAVKIKMGRVVLNAMNLTVYKPKIRKKIVQLEMPFITAVLGFDIRYAARKLTEFSRIWMLKYLHRFDGVDRKV